MLGKQFVIFVDDFNMPKRETYGAQPPLELMRQMVDHGGWYDRKTLRWKKIVDVVLVGAMGPPGGGRRPVTNRMLRLMHCVSFVDMSDATIKGIFNTITAAFLQNTFGEEKMGLAPPIVAATVEIFNQACMTLLPTPAKSHYIFNLRDVSKVTSMEKLATLMNESPSSVACCSRLTTRTCTSCTSRRPRWATCRMPSARTSTSRSAWPTSSRRCACPTNGRASTCATALTWSTDLTHHLYSSNNTHHLYTKRS